MRSGRFGSLAPLARSETKPRMAARRRTSKEVIGAEVRTWARLYSGLLDRGGVECRRRRRRLQQRSHGGRYLRRAELRIATQAELRRLDHQRDERVVVPGCAVVG